jgi:hypothetical protein
MYKILNKWNYLEANRLFSGLVLGLDESRFHNMTCPAMTGNVPLIKQLSSLTVYLLNYKWFVYFLFIFRKGFSPISNLLVCLIQFQLKKEVE